MSVLSIIVLLAAVVAVVAIVLVSRRQTEDSGDYLTGGQQMGGIVTAFTFSASGASAGLFLGGAGMAYTFGWPGAMYQFGSIGGIFLSWVLLGPQIRKLAGRTGAISTPVLIAKEYGKPILRLITAIWTTIFIVPMMIVQFRGAALLFETNFGLSYVASLVVFGLIVAVFTAAGGYFAVAYLDTLQGVIMTIGMAILLPTALNYVGGFSGLNNSLAAIDPALVDWFGHMPKPLLFGLTITYLVSFLGQPHLIPRFISLKDSTAARVAFPLSMALTGFWMLSGCIVGLTTRVAFPGLDTGDLAMPTAIANFLPVTGILVWLALVSAVMSTIDSLLLAVGTSISHDIVKGYIKKDLSPEKELFISKISVFVLCIIAFVLAINPPNLMTIINSFAMGAFVLILGIPLLMIIYMKKRKIATVLTSTIGGPIIYIVWKTLLADRTGMHEMIGTLLVLIPLLFIVQRAAPSKKEHKLSA